MQFADQKWKDNLAKIDSRFKFAVFQYDKKDGDEKQDTKPGEEVGGKSNADLVANTMAATKRWEISKPYSSKPLETF